SKRVGAIHDHIGMKTQFPHQSLVARAAQTPFATVQRRPAVERHDHIDIDIRTVSRGLRKYQVSVEARGLISVHRTSTSFGGVSAMPEWSRCANCAEVTPR